MIGTVILKTPTVQVCAPSMTATGQVPNLGSSCEIAAKPPRVWGCSAADESGALRVSWGWDNAGASQQLLHSYRIRAFRNDDLGVLREVWSTPLLVGPSTTSQRFATIPAALLEEVGSDPGGSQQTQSMGSVGGGPAKGSSKVPGVGWYVAKNTQYDFTVEAVYDRGTVSSAVQSCGASQPPNSLCASGWCACAPVHGNAPTCGCPANTVHTAGLPGLGPEAFSCIQCDTLVSGGINCTGGTFSAVKSLEGW